MDTYIRINMNLRIYVSLFMLTRMYVDRYVCYPFMNLHLSSTSTNASTYLYISLSVYRFINNPIEHQHTNVSL